MSGGLAVALEVGDEDVVGGEAGSGEEEEARAKAQRRRDKFEFHWSAAWAGGAIRIGRL